jgi:hypothetical protein
MVYSKPYGSSYPARTPMTYYEQVVQNLIVKGFVFIGAGIGLYVGISIVKSLFD